MKEEELQVCKRYNFSKLAANKGLCKGKNQRKGNFMWQLINFVLKGQKYWPI